MPRDADDSATVPGFRAIIPAGGIGSRLWPLSRANAPKFLHDLSGSGGSLLRDTWLRLAPIAGPERVMVVTGRSHRAAVESAVPELDDPNIVLESSPRDSSAAIGLAAAILERREPGVIVGSFAADHVIRDNRRVPVRRRGGGRRGAQRRGRHDRHPAHGAGGGFGYIECGDAAAVDGAPSALAVRSFVEKPTLAVAEGYVADGRHLWNAGMFIARAEVLLEQLGRSRPELLAGLEELAAAWDTPERGAVVDRVWPTLEQIAIDYTVAEPAAQEGRMLVIPGYFDWDDVGDFASIGKLHGGSGDLAILGDNARVLADSSSGVVVSHTGRTISLVGVQDIVVVDTPDALLVTTTANAQRVKAVVDALKLSGRDDVL